MSGESFRGTLFFAFCHSVLPVSCFCPEEVKEEPGDSSEPPLRFTSRISETHPEPSLPLHFLLALLQPGLLVRVWTNCPASRSERNFSTPHHTTPHREVALLLWAHGLSLGGSKGRIWICRDLESQVQWHSQFSQPREADSGDHVSCKFKANSGNMGRVTTASLTSV